MYRYVSYYRPALENSYIFHASIYPLDIASGNESVLLVPGSIEQMQDDMDNEDFIESMAMEIWDKV